MSDRDIPSVPVTTLAGLASLSDLLSELPISDSLSITTSLNKTLLFHPRVAEEANNLLAVDDDALVRQLVQALEQTNSDQIELKEQYPEQNNSNTSADTPQLLQAIYSYKPSVFNNPIQSNINQRYLHQQQQQHFQIQQQHHQSSSHINQLHDQPQQQYNTLHQQQQQNEILQFNTQSIQLTGNNSSSSPSSSSSWNHNMNPLNVTQQQTTILQTSSDTLPINQQIILHQQQPQFQSGVNYIPSSTISSDSQNSVIIQLQQQQQLQQIGENKTEDVPVIFLQQQQHQLEQHEPQTQFVQTYQQNENQSQIQIIQESSVQQQQHLDGIIQQQQQFPIELDLNHHLGQHHQVQFDMQQQQNQLQQNQLQQHQLIQKQIIPHHPHLNQHQHQLEQHEQMIIQKGVPCNNEYFEQQQQNKNLDIRGQSPAQGNDSTNHIIKDFNINMMDNYLTDNSSSSLMNHDQSLSIRMPKICLNRLTKEDQDLIQESITKFAEKSPELAKKLGISKDDSNDSTSIFSKMKADETTNVSLPCKRKILDETQSEGELFSKPKLRKVERKIIKTPTKLTKDDIIRSNTYQRFMSTMEQILEHLDEPDAPINLDDNYENVECIPGNMLQSISAEAAKLKAKGNAIELLPQNKLTLLINYAIRSVTVAKNFSAGPDMQDDLVADECLEKILNAIEASLLICNIYSCRNTSSLQEDNIDIIIKFVQFQLRETIFPSYDCVYTFETKKKDNKKKKSMSNHQREMSRLYSKIVELTKVIDSLMAKFQFEDTIIIHASALGIEPFFVDNIETLQFVCLDLVTTIFQNDKYKKHRGNILSEILSSIDRLPYSKRNLRPYKLTNNSGNIQMITALVLQLIQCSVILPETMNEDNTKISKKKQNNENKVKIDKDLIVREKYETAVSIGGNFLSTFLNKCRVRSGETDFRPIFENFIQDLLTTVNKPEWPAAELLLSLLGTLLVNSMSDKSIDQALRVVSLEYLGMVAARLRKDTVVSRCKVNTMDQLIKCIKIEQEKEGDQSDEESTIEIDQEEERTEFLERILLDFLAVNAQEENIVWSHSRHFYLTQWYKDILQRKKKIADGEKGYASRKKTPKKRRKFKNDSDSSDNDDNDSDVDDVKTTVDQELNLEIFRILDQRKKYLLSKISPYSDSSKVQDVKTYIDYSNAQLIAQYLASKRLFSQSFDKYLRKIILVVREQSIAIRTKAMKCLASIVEVDPSILKRKDMQMGVNQKFLDTSISVREAAVDLVGKYVLNSPELINQYYDMLSKRILDTGVSVRKRVIKILRDICIEYPDFDKIPEICVKMIRRVNDEEGIQKLVTEVFLHMWFTPCKENDKIAMERKITQIIDVVNSSHDTGMQWLDGLLKTIFQSKECKDNATIRKEPPKTIVIACQQIVDGLVNALIKLDSSDGDDKKLLGCVTTLNLFAKIRPLLLVRHAMTMEPFLNIKCTPDSPMVKFISVVAEILEQVVPLIEHPSETFLSDLEAHLLMLIVVHSQTVLLTCISCLAAIVNKLTKNYKLIRDCFVKYYYKTLAASKDKLTSDPNYPMEYVYKKAIFRRSIYIVGLIMRYFDFTDPDVYGANCNIGPIFPSTICDEVFETLMFFLICDNADIRKETLKSLGYFCVTNFNYLTKPELRNFYHDLMIMDTVTADMKTIVLRNILTYLTEEEQKHLKNEQDWRLQSRNEDLKEMGDVSSGMSSTIIQLYIKDILECFLHIDFNVRLWAMKAIDVVLRQGLVHPVQIVPYLICLSTDAEKEVAHCADHHLQEIDKQYPGFINMKSQHGIQLSFELQTILKPSIINSIVRGFRSNQKDEQPSALNGFLYSLLRTTKPQRRALIQSITKQFDNQKTTLRQMLYLADNLAYFPYLVQDEPLYIIHQIDVLISVTGTNLLSNFRDGLKPSNTAEINPNEPVNHLDEDEEDDKDILYSRLPDDTSDLQKCIRAAQGCMLLLILKEHLKEFYGLTDGKIARYSPSEAGKIYEKTMQRRSLPPFNPKATVEALKEEATLESIVLNEDKKWELITKYLDFKQLMLKLDPEDGELDDDDRPIKPTPTKADTDINNLQNQNENDNNHDMNNVHVVNNINNYISGSTVPVSIPIEDPVTIIRKEIPLANTRAPKKRTPKKQENKKKKKKKIVSSSSEESDYSDPDYD